MSAGPGKRRCRIKNRANNRRWYYKQQLVKTNLQRNHRRRNADRAKSQD